jgi:putative transposase
MLTHKIIGWYMTREQLVIDALEFAVFMNPLIIHIYRGANFVGKRYHSELNKYNIISSMSKPGNPYNNSIIESFNKPLETMIFD